MTHVLEKPPQSLFVDALVVRLIDGLEYAFDRESIQSVDVLLELLNVKLEVDFLGK